MFVLNLHQVDFEYKSVHTTSESWPELCKDTVPKVKQSEETTAADWIQTCVSNIQDCESFHQQQFCHFWHCRSSKNNQAPEIQSEKIEPPPASLRWKYDSY